MFLLLLLKGIVLPALNLSTLKLGLYSIHYIFSGCNFSGEKGW